MALAHITDLADRAKARMLVQYRALTKYVADVATVVGEVQELEDAFWDFFERLDLDVADGVWLERLGSLIGELREGEASESQYRSFIKARVLANKSQGTTEDIVAVVLQALEGIGFALSVVDWYPAAQTVTIGEDVQLGGQGNVEWLKRIVRLIRIARAVGVGTTLLYQDCDDTDSFVCGDSLGSDPTGKGFDDAAAPDDPTAGRLSGADAA